MASVAAPPLSSHHFSNALRIPLWHETFFCNATFLDEGVGDAFFEGVIDEAFVLAFCDAAVDFRPFFEAREGGELVHETEVDLIAVGVVDVVDDAFCVMDHRGHEEVADDDAFLHHPAIVEDGFRALADHLGEAFLRAFRVVAGAGVLLCLHAVHVLEVVEVDVREAVEAADQLGRFVAGAVDDEGDLQSLHAASFHGLRDEGDVVVRGHEVDVVRALRLQLEEDLRESLEADALSDLLVAQLIILAEHALQGAAGEEHCTATFFSGDARLLPEVERRPRDVELGTDAADALLPRVPVHAALSRTEPAVLHTSFHPVSLLLTFGTARCDGSPRRSGAPARTSAGNRCGPSPSGAPAADEAHPRARSPPRSGCRSSGRPHPRTTRGSCASRADACSRGSCSGSRFPSR